MELTSDDTVTLTLTNGESTTDLVFKPFDNSVGRKWFNSICQVNEKGRLYERDRLYDFPNEENSLEHIAKKIDTCIDEINKLQPGLITEKVDMDNIQDSVNRLHVHFADSHIVKQSVNEDNLHLWNDFNSLLHQFENAERSLEAESYWGIPFANIVVTWLEDVCHDLEDQDYQYFTLDQEFGTVYANYCQIGRHFYELFLAGDDIAEDTHVLPLRRLSASTYIWLGRTRNEEMNIREMGRIEKWFKENEKRFNDLGHYWGDPKLAIGWIPVAKLLIPNDVDTIPKQKELLKELSKYNLVESLRPTKI